MIIGLTVSGLAVLFGIACIVGNALRKCGDDAPYEITEADWTFTVADVERASRLHNDERDML